MPTVLAPGDDLPPKAYALARMVAGHFSQGGARLHPVLGRDDMEQQALLAALLYLRRTERDDSEEGFSSTLLQRVMRRRVIDWMRSENPLTHNRGQPPLPLDDILASHLPDPADPYQEVEDVATVQSLINSYPGPPWHIEVALLVAHGCTLQDVADFYGITESRAQTVWATFLRGVRPLAA